MYGHLKISHHRHSGHLRPHEHTSYIPLMFIVILTGIILVGYSISAFAQSPGPEGASIGLSGTVPETPPKVAATITNPTNGQHFLTSPITVSGSCPSGTLIEIYKNDIFAGSIPCGNDGTYSLEVDLLYGQNTLTAQVYDILNQAGPVSSPVVVYYDATPPQTAGLSNLTFTGTQLLLETNPVYRGTFPGQTLYVPITIIGGIPPFALNIEWGDSTNATHVYQKPGTYKITIQGSDSKQQVAFLSVAVIVNGQPSVINASNSSNISKSTSNKLLVLWPLYAIILAMVVSFWLGERREKRLLRASSPLQNPTFGIAPHPNL